jgi:putative endonuclease
MYYIYVLLDERDRRLLSGFTHNLKKRMELHRRGFMMKTNKCGPLKLIYLEVCLNREDAVRRDKYLNSFRGKRYLKNRLKNFFGSS